MSIQQRRCSGEELGVPAEWLVRSSTRQISLPVSGS